MPDLRGYSPTIAHQTELGNEVTRQIIERIGENIAIAEQLKLTACAVADRLFGADCEVSELTRGNPPPATGQILMVQDMLSSLYNQLINTGEQLQRLAKL